MKVFVQAWRMIRSYRLYSVINMLGLALGLACTIILARYIHRESTVDGFHHDSDAVVASVVSDVNGADTPKMFGVGVSGADKNPMDNSEIAAWVNVNELKDKEVKVGQRGQRFDILAADTTFGDVFDFPLAVGDMRTILADPGSAILSPEAARRLFGDDDPLGRQITIDDKPLTVAGLLVNPSGKSSIKFDVLISYRFNPKWGSANMTFARLHSADMLAPLNERIKGDTFEFWGKQLCSYQLISTRDLYFSNVSKFSPTMYLSGDSRSVKVLTIVMFAVLLIGIFNFVNIYSVTLLRRGKELGLKKVFGVTPAEMLRQLVVENFMMVVMSTFAALLLVEITVPLVEGRLGIPVVTNPSFDALLIAGIVILMPLVTALYPFIKYSYRSPIVSIRDVRGGKSASFNRSVFVVVQYVATIVLVVVSIYFVRQLNFMLNAPMGYSAHNVILAQIVPPIDYSRMRNMSQEQSQEFWSKRNGMENLAKDMIGRNPVFQTYYNGQNPIQIARRDFTSNMRNSTDSTGEWKKVTQFSVSSEFFEVFDITQIDGQRLTDSLHGIRRDAQGNFDGQLSAVVNRKAATLLGVKVGDVLDAENSYTYFSTPNGVQGDSRRYPVVGIVDDFAAGHLSKEIMPMVIMSSSNGFGSDNITTVRYAPGRDAEAIAALADIFRQINPDGEFKYEMAADQVAALYTEDRKVANIYTTFAMIAILISSLGLFGLSVYDVQQRTREIAIRKVHGSTEGEIIAMLCRKYYILLGISFVIATPLAIFAVRSYMADFAVRAPLSWWIFAAAAAVTALISLLTLIWQTSRAARTNPSRAIGGNS